MENKPFAERPVSPVHDGSLEYYNARFEADVARVGINGIWAETMLRLRAADYYRFHLNAWSSTPPNRRMYNVQPR